MKHSKVASIVSNATTLSNVNDFITVALISTEQCGCYVVCNYHTLDTM